jgi:hypothetical protein
MTSSLKLSMTSALLIAFGAAAHAGPTASVFATGAAVGGTQPDSVTIGGGSVWIEYGNGASSTGAGGSSTIVQYGANGAVQHTYSIAGSVDGLKFNPVTGKVWALQNQDGNSTLSIIDPTTHTVSGPLSYAVMSATRGYDDAAFLGGKVYLSYTNPATSSDSILQTLNNGNNPTGTLTTTSILTGMQAGNATDPDSLKSTPNGQLTLTSGGDGTFTLISNPGAANQTETTIQVTSGGVNVSSLDDVLFPTAASGIVFVTNTGGNDVLALRLSGLSPTTPIVAIGGSLNELAFVDLTTGIATPLLTGLSSPHGLEFAAPEPSTWAMMLLGFAGLGYAAYRRTRKASIAVSAQTTS